MPAKLAFEIKAIADDRQSGRIPFYAIRPANCMQLRRSIDAQL
jgi:hypothetical protein